MKAKKREYPFDQDLSTTAEVDHKNLTAEEIILSYLGETAKMSRYNTDNEFVLQAGAATSAGTVYDVANATGIHNFKLNGTEKARIDSLGLKLSNISVNSNIMWYDGNVQAATSLVWDNATHLLTHEKGVSASNSVFVNYKQRVSNNSSIKFSQYLTGGSLVDIAEYIHSMSDQTAGNYGNIDIQLYHANVGPRSYLKLGSNEVVLHGYQANVAGGWVNGTGYTDKLWVKSLFGGTNKRALRLTASEGDINSGMSAEFLVKDATAFGFFFQRGHYQGDGGTAWSLRYSINRLGAAFFDSNVNSNGNIISAGAAMVRATNAGGQGTYIELAKYLGSAPGYAAEYYPVLKTDYTDLLVSVGGRFHTDFRTDNSSYNEQQIRSFAGGTAGTSVVDVSFRTDGQPSFLRTGRFGIGITSPGYALDVETATGNTNAKFGLARPVYIVYDDPAFGFNSYYNGAWRFGKGSTAHYAGIVSLNAVSGYLSFRASIAAGAADANVGTYSQMVFTKDNRLGIGLTSPTHPLDVETVVGNTHAKFGVTHPVYIMSDNPVVGYNAYYNSGWKYGKGSVSKYAGFVGFQATSGYLDFSVSNATGNSDAGVGSLAQMVFSKDGYLGIATNAPITRLDAVGNVSIRAGNLDSQSLAFFQNTGGVLVGWNRSAGAGRTDFISNRGGGSTGGFQFWDLTNGGVLNHLMSIDNDGSIITTGAMQTFGHLYLRQSVYLLNKAGNGWNLFASRDISGDEARYDINFIRDISIYREINAGGRSYIGFSAASEQTFNITPSATSPTLVLATNGGSVGHGSSVSFGAGGKQFAAIKAYFTDGTNYGVGDLAISLRNGYNNANLTAVLTLSQAGNVGVANQITAGGYIVSNSGVVQAYSSNSAQGTYIELNKMQNLVPGLTGWYPSIKTNNNVFCVVTTHVANGADRFWGVFGTGGGDNYFEIRKDNDPNTNGIVLRSNGKSYFNGSYIGIGNTNPGVPLDIEMVVGNTNAKFGTTHPLYIISDSPNIGLNSYFNAGWKFGKGSVGKYAGIIGLNQTDGKLELQVSNATGNADAAVSFVSGLVVTKDNRVGIATGSPSYTLHVNGDIGFNGTLQNGSIPAARVTAGTFDPGNFAVAGNFETAYGTITARSGASDPTYNRIEIGSQHNSYTFIKAGMELRLYTEGLQVASMLRQTGTPNIGYFEVYGSTTTRIGAGGISSSFGSKVDINYGSFITVMNETNGTSAYGIRLWSSGNSDWGIYMGQSGGGRSMSNGAACASLSGRTSHSFRSRISNANDNSFIWENNSESCLMSLDADTGNLHIKGAITHNGGNINGYSEVIGKTLRTRESLGGGPLGGYIQCDSTSDLKFYTRGDTQKMLIATDVDVTTGFRVSGTSSFGSGAPLSSRVSIKGNSALATYIESGGSYNTGSTNMSQNNLIRLEGTIAGACRDQITWSSGGGGGVGIGLVRGGGYDTYLEFLTNPSSTGTPGALRQAGVFDHNGLLTLNYGLSVSGNAYVSGNTGFGTAAGFERLLVLGTSKVQVDSGLYLFDLYLNTNSDLNACNIRFGGNDLTTHYFGVASYNYSSFSLTTPYGNVIAPNNKFYMFAGSMNFVFNTNGDFHYRGSIYGGNVFSSAVYGKTTTLAGLKIGPHSSNSGWGSIYNVSSGGSETEMIYISTGAVQVNTSKSFYAFGSVYFGTYVNCDLYTSGTLDYYVGHYAGQLVKYTSSARYKKEIDYNYDASFLREVKPVTYRTISGDTFEHGLIAEDVVTVVPEFVTFNKLGQPDAVKYMSFIPSLIKFSCDLDKKIDTLELRVSILESKIT